MMRRLKDWYERWVSGTPWGIEVWLAIGILGGLIFWTWFFAWIISAF